tara:strand:+ start:258 stop:506 length:249 start_codon:yes stop_codon:yes gene_type:complete
MAITNSKLTSVKVLKDLYDKFRVSTVNSEMTLQKLTNRCIHLYLNDDEFKDQVESTDDLTISGSSLKKKEINYVKEKNIIVI